VLTIGLEFSFSRPRGMEADACRLTGSRVKLRISLSALAQVRNTIVGT